MRNIFIVTGLLFCLLVPAFAAETPEATAKRVTDLQKTVQSLIELQGNTQLTLDTTKEELQAALDKETKARKDLEDRVAKMQEALDTEKTARTTADTATNKLVDELKVALVNEQMKTDALQVALDKERNERLASANELNKAVAKNSTQDKKDRTIGYALSALLGIAVLSK